MLMMVGYPIMDLTLCDIRIEIGEELRNFPVDLATDLHGDDRIDRAGCGHDRRDRPSIDKGRLVLDRQGARVSPVPQATPADEQDHHDTDEPGQT
jgi:hypothetical protein